MSIFFFYSYSILSILILVFLFLWDLKRRSPFFMLWIAILFIVILPSLSDPFNRVVTPHQFASTLIIDDNSLVIYALYGFLILLSIAFCYIFLYMSFDRHIKVSYLKYKNIKRDKKSIYYLLFLMVSLIGFYFFYKIFGVSLLTSLDFSTRREYSSPLLSFTLSYPFMVCSGLGLYYLINKKYRHFLLVLFFYMALFFVFGGSRQPFTALIMPIIAYYIIGSEKINYRVLAAVIIISFFTTFASDLLIYLRNLPSFEERLDLVLNPKELLLMSSSREGDESNVRYAYYYFIQNSNLNNGYFNFDYFSRTLLFWLPSIVDLFNIKPNDFEYKMFFDYMNGHSGTMHPTFFGSIYADSGWFFFPWVVLLSFFIYLVPVYIQRFNGVAYFCLWSVCLFYSIMLARGSFYGSITVIMVALLFAILIKKITFSNSRGSNETNSSRHG